MSNHSGGYMLNEVLALLEKESVFEFWGKVKTQKLVRDIVRIGYDYDCNSGEILEDIGIRIGLCSCCRKPTEEFRNGLCQNCCGESFSDKK
ncbi:MAG: hypothetical protein WA947_13780 [Phormidesmis sp.]